VPGRHPQADQPARAPYAQLEAPLYPSSDVPAQSVACRMCLSSVRSATNRLSRAFPSRSWHSSRTASRLGLPWH
jgi:hypothetical protein